MFLLNRSEKELNIKLLRDRLSFIPLVMNLRQVKYNINHHILLLKYKAINLQFRNRPINLSRAT